MAEIVEKPKSATAKDIAKRILGYEPTVLIIVLGALMLVFSALSHGLTIRRANILNVLLQSATKGVASIGQAFVILTGGIDLAVAGTGLLSAIVGGTMMTQAPELNIVGYAVPLAVAMPVMLVIGLGVGAGNGLIISRVGMPPLIVTLAIWQIVKGIAYRTSQGLSIIGLPDSLIPFGRGTVGGMPTPVIAQIEDLVHFPLLFHPNPKKIFLLGGGMTGLIDEHKSNMYSYLRTFL